MTRSFWLQEALAADRDDAPALEGDIRADLCIVGGGYTGLWTAIRAKQAEPAIDIVIVERDLCGGGASGRNGGFVMSWWAKFLSLAKVCGVEQARMLAQASDDAVGDIEDFCADHGVDAGFRRDGWIWTATNAAQVGAWNSLVDALARYQIHPFTELSPEEVRERSGSPLMRAGILEPSAATIQPAALARGLRRHALELGVRIFEHSPMTELSRTRPPRVRTFQGSVSADRVVLAMNAWGVRFPELRRLAVVVASDIIATAPAPRRLAEIGLTSGAAISDSRYFMNYYRSTPDGRIVFGKALGRFAFAGRVDDRFDGETPRAAELEESLRQFYPMLGEVPVVANWTGPIDRSVDGLPVFGHLGGHPDILYGIGYSGQGVAPTAVGGRILASLALDRNDEWANCGLVRERAETFPPEPLRFFGSLAVRKALADKERSEDLGRKPSRLATRLSALAPAGFVPSKGKRPRS